jgi:hypothetical protein
LKKFLKEEEHFHDPIIIQALNILQYHVTGLPLLGGSVQQRPYHHSKAIVATSKQSGNASTTYIFDNMQASVQQFPSCRYRSCFEMN